MHSFVIDSTASKQYAWFDAETTAKYNHLRRLHWRTHRSHVILLRQAARTDGHRSLVDAHSLLTHFSFLRQAARTDGHWSLVDAHSLLTHFSFRHLVMIVSTALLSCFAAC